MPFLENTPSDLSTARGILQMAPTLALHLERDIKGLTPVELARLEPWAFEMIENVKKGGTDCFSPNQILIILASVAMAIVSVYNLAPPKKETTPAAPHHERVK